jgi:phage terminase large subunit GpA-like protein
MKHELYGWLKLDKPTQADELYPAGYCHFPEYDTEYFRQLTAEQCVEKLLKNGGTKWEWEKIYRDNHALDARLYARAAACVVGLDRFQSVHWSKIKKDLRI